MTTEAESASAVPATLEDIARLGSDPRFGPGRICVLDADTGRLLIDRAADRPGPTASVMKVITAAAALTVLGPDFRIETRVVAGAQPDEIVLIGGGDVTLTRVPAGGETFYANPARLDDLARQTLTARGGIAPRRIVLDDSLYRGGEWNATEWVAEDRDPGGYMPIMSALQVDADRLDPAADDSPRSLDPTGRVGVEFARMLGGNPEIVRGRAEPNAEVLATVASPPVEALVRETMLSSDNAIAETLARRTALALGAGVDFAGIADALRSQLEVLGVPVAGARLIDGSGLSPGIRVSATTIADLVRRIRLREGNLGVLDDRFTRSGPDGTGSLSRTRFAGPNAVVGGNVRAKTGFIDSVHSLAGIVRTRGGHDLVFAVFAMAHSGVVDRTARDMVDEFVAQLYRDGDALLELDTTLQLAD